MANRLDTLLEPGEQIVYRDPRGLLPPGFWASVLAGPFIAALLGVRYFPLGDPMIVAIAKTIVLGSLGLVVLMALRSWAMAGNALVTDRRVLWRGGAQGPDGAVAIPLAEIAAVTLVSAPGGLTVRVARRDGTPLDVHGLRRAQPFAAALAEQAALPCPPLVGRLENLTLYCLFLGGLPIALHLKILAEEFRFMPAPPVTALDLPLTVVATQIPLVLGVWLGSHLAALLAFAVMPWLIDPERAQAWLALKPEAGPWRWLARWSGWKSPLHALLVRRLYRAPFAKGRTPAPA